jgi:hypothetical protein
VFRGECISLSTSSLVLHVGPLPVLGFWPQMVVDPDTSVIMYGV